METLDFLSLNIDSCRILLEILSYSEMLPVSIFFWCPAQSLPFNWFSVKLSFDYSVTWYFSKEQAYGYSYAHLNTHYGLCQSLGTWVQKSYSACYAKLWNQKPAPSFLSLLWDFFLFFLKYSVDFRPLFSFSQWWWRTNVLKLRRCSGDISVDAPTLLQLRSLDMLQFMHQMNFVLQTDGQGSRSSSLLPKEGTLIFPLFPPPLAGSWPRAPAVLHIQAPTFVWALDESIPPPIRQKKTNPAKERNKFKWSLQVEVAHQRAAEGSALKLQKAGKRRRREGRESQ